MKLQDSSQLKLEIDLGKCFQLKLHSIIAKWGMQIANKSKILFVEKIQRLKRWINNQILFVETISNRENVDNYFRKDFNVKRRIYKRAKIPPLAAPAIFLLHPTWVLRVHNKTRKTILCNIVLQHYYLNKNLTWRLNTSSESSLSAPSS